MIRLILVLAALAAAATAYAAGPLLLHIGAPASTGPVENLLVQTGTNLMVQTGVPMRVQ